MNTSHFESALRRDGFNEILTREMEANCSVAEHDHPFDVRALVLDGEITLTVAGSAQAYRAGDEFTMAAGCRHQEDTGAQGVRLLVGRRQPV